MSWLVMLTQVLLPLVLLGWLALFPAAGWLARVLQLVSVAAVFVGLWLTALWTMPPFWVPYLVAHGGSNEMVNVHLKTLNESVERFRPWRGQSKALDIFRVTPLGLHKEGWRPREPAKYLTFGTPVLAPCQGQVAKVVDANPDMTVPDMDRSSLPGNYVAIDCGDFFVILAHLQRSSVTAVAGEPVQVGDVLGRMGNSGNSSEPHLHIHAQRGLPAQAAFGGEPLWLAISGRFLVRNDRIHID